MVKEKSFEEAMKRLEEIIHKLEEGELPLEKSLKMFEEGINLSKMLTQKLAKAEAKVQKLIGTEEGKFKTEPLGLHRRGKKLE